MSDMSKQQRRAAMPIVTAFVDDIRKHFGVDAIVAIKASENGQKIEWRKQTERN
jgi:peptidase E